MLLHIISPMERERDVEVNSSIKPLYLNEDSKCILHVTIAYSTPLVDYLSNLFSQFFLDAPIVREKGRSSTKEGCC